MTGRTPASSSRRPDLRRAGAHRGCGYEQARMDRPHGSGQEMGRHARRNHGGPGSRQHLRGQARELIAQLVARSKDERPGRRGIVTEESITLDERRGMMAQRATEIRRRLAHVEVDRVALKQRRGDLEKFLLTAPGNHLGRGGGEGELPDHAPGRHTGGPQSAPAEADRGRAQRFQKALGRAEKHT